jgi:hypothetical protein
MFVNLLSQNRSSTPNHEHATSFERRRVDVQQNPGWLHILTEVSDYQSHGARIIRCSCSQSNRKTTNHRGFIWSYFDFLCKKLSDPNLSKFLYRVQYLILIKFMLLLLLLQFFYSSKWLMLLFVSGTYVSIRIA